jgi:hypothetical protein
MVGLWTIGEDFLSFKGLDLLHTAQTRLRCRFFEVVWSFNPMKKSVGLKALAER